jgi:hypothetical protein
VGGWEEQIMCCGVIERKKLCADKCMGRSIHSVILDVIPRNILIRESAFAGV